MFVLGMEWFQEWNPQADWRDLEFTVKTNTGTKHIRRLQTTPELQEFDIDNPEIRACNVLTYDIIRNPTDADGCRRMPTDADGCRRMPTDADGCRRIADGLPADCRRVAEGLLKDCRRMPTDADGCRRTPTDTDGHRRTPTDTDGHRRTPTDTDGRKP